MCASPSRQEDIHAIRVAAGDADLVLGCDLVVTGSKKVLAAVRSGATRLVVNTAEFLPGDFTRDADYSLPSARIKRAILAAAGSDQVSFVDASTIATTLLGNSIAANMFMLGFAYQKGAVPLSAEALEHAIELNGEAVKMNVAAFRWGRRTAHDPAAVESFVAAATRPTQDRKLSHSLDERIERRVEFLADYQNAAYAPALSRPRRKSAGGRGAHSPWRDRPRRSGRPLLLQASRL